MNGKSKSLLPQERFTRDERNCIPIQYYREQEKVVLQFKNKSAYIRFCMRAWKEVHGK